jgi:type II secretory pathway component PulM
MKPLQVEFLRTPAPGRWHWAVAILAAASALYALIDAGLSYRQLQDRRSEIAIWTASVASAAPASGIVKPTPTYERSAREMLAAAQAPWPEALIALETASVPGVKVNLVEIVVAERMVRVELQALSYAAILEYLDELNAGEPAQRWVLQSAESQPGALGVGNGQVVGRIHRRF